MWNNDCPEKFVDAIDILKLSEIESKLDNLITNDFSKSELDLIVHDISRLFLDSAQTAFGEKIILQRHKYSTTKIKVNPGATENVRKHGRNSILFYPITLEGRRGTTEGIIKAKNRYRVNRYKPIEHEN